MKEDILNICCKGPHKKNIGSYLTILQELILISKIYKKKKFNFFFKNKVDIKFFYDNFIKFCNIDINIIKQDLKKISNAIDLDKLKPKKQIYSLSRINYFYKSYKVQPILKWNKKTDLETKKILEKFKLKKFVIITLKRDKNLSFASAKISVWNKIIQYLLKKGYSIVVIGDDNFDNWNLKKELNDKIIFLKDYNFSIASQFNLIKKSNFFLGTASGICMIACFSNKPYAIFKHPKHHVTEMKKELLNNKTFFYKKKQYFFIAHQTYVNIKKAIKIFLK